MFRDEGGYRVGRAVDESSADTTRFQSDVRCTNVLFLTTKYKNNKVKRNERGLERRERLSSTRAPVKKIRKIRPSGRREANRACTSDLKRIFLLASIRSTRLRHFSIPPRRRKYYRVPSYRIIFRTTTFRVHSCEHRLPRYRGAYRAHSSARL